MKVVGRPSVGIGVAAYLNDDPRQAAALRCMLASFQAQTFVDWRMKIVHDGLIHKDVDLGPTLKLCHGDSRVQFTETLERKKNFGHPHRQQALDGLMGTCTWVMLTNQDNYYMPVFLEWLLGQAGKSKGTDFVYCDMIHSHKLWKPVVTQPRYKHLDLGGFIVKASVAKQVPFDKVAFNADGDWINRLVQRSKVVVKVPAVLYVHN